MSTYLLMATASAVLALVLAGAVLAATSGDFDRYLPAFLAEFAVVIVAYVALHLISFNTLLQTPFGTIDKYTTASLSIGLALAIINFYIIAARVSELWTGRNMTERLTQRAGQARILMSKLTIGTAALADAPTIQFTFEPQPRTADTFYGFGSKSAVLTR